MWKTVSSIKSAVGLSAFSLAVAYLLADKIIEKGLINTSFGVALLLIFLFLFFMTNLLIITLSKRGQEGAPSGELHQQVGLAREVKQTARVAKGSESIPNVTQTTTAAKSVEQNIESDWS